MPLTLLSPNREDDFEKKAEDPKFTGFHRLEKALFGDNSVKGMDFDGGNASSLMRFCSSSTSLFS
jgi:iron uptake system EfeUOB component EfeO/EfeM